MNHLYNSEGQEIHTWVSTRNKPSGRRVLLVFFAVAIANLVVVAWANPAYAILDPEEAMGWLLVVNALGLLAAGSMGVSRLTWIVFGANATIISQLLELAGHVLWLFVVFGAIALAT